MVNDKTSNKKVKNAVAVSDNEINEIISDQPFFNIRNTDDTKMLLKQAMKKGNTKSITKAIKFALIHYNAN